MDFLFQLGTLGAGNHYAEIQVVDEIYNSYNARKMGIDRKGQVCVMVHCGSRGLGHQVATGENNILSCILFFLFFIYILIISITCTMIFMDSKKTNIVYT